MAPLDDFGNSIQIRLAMFRISLHAPADIIHAIGHREHRGSLGDHGFFQSLQTQLGRFAALAGVDEADLAFRKSHQGVVLDDFGIVPCRRNAVAQERHGVAVAEGEILRRQRGQRKSGGKQ